MNYKLLIAAAILVASTAASAAAYHERATTVQAWTEAKGADGIVMRFIEVRYDDCPPGSSGVGRIDEKGRNTNGCWRFDKAGNIRVDWLAFDPSSRRQRLDGTSTVYPKSSLRTNSGPVLDVPAENAMMARDVSRQCGQYIFSNGYQAIYAPGFVTCRERVLSHGSE